MRIKKSRVFCQNESRATRERIERCGTMAIAKKISGFISQSSFIRRMFEEGIRLKKQYGEDAVFDFSLGNPNVAPPEEFCKRLRELSCADIPGKHMYMPNAGYPETRAAVADSVGCSQEMTLSADQVIMTWSAESVIS
jgi:aspartate aminotransferase